MILGDRDVGGVQGVLRTIWEDATGFVKWRLVWVLLLIVMTSMLAALGPVALKLIVDGLAKQAQSPFISTFALIVLYVLSQWLIRAIGELRGFLYVRAERRMLRMLSERLFGHLMRLPLQFHLNRQTGAVGKILDNGLQGYQLILHHMVFTLLPVFVELGTILLILSRLSQLTFVALFCAALPCYALMFAHAAKSVSGIAKSAASAHINASATMTDSILNYETVKYFAAEHLVQEKVASAFARTEAEWSGFYRRYAGNALGVATIFAAFLGVTMFYAASEVQSGAMTVGTFVLIGTYMLQIVRPVEMLGFGAQGFSQGLAMLQRMLELLRETPEPQQARRPIDCNGCADVEFQDVSLSYRADRCVLRHVSFRIGAGKTLGIVGASGSGKTTIVRLLVRLFEPDSGRVLIDGVPVGEIPLPDLRRSVAVVPQETVLFDDTIAFNIAFGKPQCTHPEIENAAKLANLHDFIMALPEQYETRVGERGVRLSGGERQRISIARAAIKQPRVFVFDEATSSLDSGTEREILANLREISQRHTTLVIAHRLSTVMHADEIVVLHAGAIVERGTHSSLLRQQGRYATLWEAQQRSSTDTQAICA